MDVIWQKADKLVVAVSGGVDSVVLLHMIASQADKENIIVAHVNHGMRETATRDCLFVKCLATKYGVKFETNQQLITLANENEARVFRYAFLSEVVSRHGAKYVLTAHHQDDQVETFLWRLIRGDGVNGLLGMPQERLLVDCATVYRPLLRWSKKDICDYAQRHHLEYTEDETNALPIYTRNRLRHTILPLLRQEQSQLDKQVTALQGELEDLLKYADDSLLQEPYIIEERLQLNSFKDLPVYTQRVLLSRWLVKAGQPTRYVDSILTLTKQSNGQKQLSLNGGWLYLQTYGQGQLMLSVEKTTPQSEVVRNFPYSVNGYEIVVGEQGIEVKDDELPLVVRGINTGDKIALKVGHKKVSRVLIDAKVPRHERQELLVLATSKNRVLSILDERFENLSKMQETGKIKKCNQIIITMRKAIE